MILLGVCIVGDGPGTGIAADCDETAQGGEGADVFLGGGQNGGNIRLGEAAFAPEVGNGGNGGDPNGAVFGQGVEGFGIEVGAVLDGVAAAFCSGEAVLFPQGEAY